MHALSQLKLKKAYTVHILEKYIPLLQFTKCIMLRSLLKCFKRVVLRHYVQSFQDFEFYENEFS